MKRLSNITLSLLLFAAAAPLAWRSPARAAEPAPDFAKTIPALLATYTKPEVDDAELQKIVFRATRPGAESERAALAKVFAAQLTPEAFLHIKIIVLRQVERIGRDETVPATVAMLADPDKRVREWAARALVANPSESAAAAIHKQYDSATTPQTQADWLNALAQRRNLADAPLFARAAQSDNEILRIPALLALARTGDAQSVSIIGAARKNGSDAAKAAANDAYLLLADRLVELDQKKTAAAMYREYFYSPTPHRTAAIIGYGKANEGEGLVTLLSDADLKARGAALTALAGNRFPQVANQIVVALSKAAPDAKPWLFRALIDQNDKRAREIITSAVEDPDPNVRQAAYALLPKVADAAIVATLLQTAQTPSDEQALARTALDNIPGKAVDDELMDRMPNGSPAERAEVIRAVGARQIAAAIDPLFKAAAPDQNAEVRDQALKAIAKVADFEKLPLVIQLLVASQDDPDRENLGKAAVAIARKNEDPAARTALIITELEKAQGPLKTTLLNLAGQLGGEKSLAAIRTAINDPDPKTHEAGIRALANWPDPGPMNDLFQLAQNEQDNTLQILSLRAFLRLAAMPNTRPPVDSIKLYTQALALAKRPEEKKQILSGLGEVKDLKSLDLVVPFLDDETFSSEAAIAAIKITRDAWKTNPDLAKQTLEKVIAKSKTPDQKRQATDILEKIQKK